MGAAVRRTSGVAAALLAALLLTWSIAGPAQAVDGTIAHVESDSAGIKVLVNLPAGADVDLTGVEATLDGDKLDAQAVNAGNGSEIKRTTMLAIDTSNSMRVGGRFGAAKNAARTYLGAVPDDVAVGVVTFNAKVRIALEPTTDREAALTVINGLTLAGGTLMYDGVVAAVNAAGDTGQRTVLVLSDGADTRSAAALDEVTRRIEDTNTLVDVVSLGQSGNALSPLRDMANAGNGQVIESSGVALAETFRKEADVLTRQVLVTAPLPSGFDAPEATVSVTLPSASGGDPVIAEAFSAVQESSGAPAPTPEADSPAPRSASSWDGPGWLLYAGLGAFAIGALAVALLLVPGKPAPMTIAERVDAYTSRTSPTIAQSAPKPATEPMLEQAKAAAAGVLERNAGLDERLKQRLAAAGSSFKPSEWLLVHVGVVLAAGVLGLLIGQGNLIVGVLFLVLGFAVPPIYLRWAAGRRRKAFDAALPEVLQLLAGGLQAGMSLPQAVNVVVDEGPEPIASEFKRVLVEARIGVPLEDAFDGVAERFQSRDFAWSVMAIRIQRQVGGNLAELLTTVGATMRERQYLRRQVQTLSAEGRMSAWVIGSLPVAFALFLFLTNREFLQPLVADARGWILLGGGVLSLSIGVFWMSRLVKVEI